MMDNLARVHSEEEPEKKPSLFLVRDQAPPSAFRAPSLGGGDPKKLVLVWGVVAAAVAILGFLLFQSLPARENSAPRVTTSGDVTSLIRGRDFKGAKKLLDELLLAQPGNRSLLINRAFVLKELGKSLAAENEYKSILSRFPQDEVVMNNLGALYLRLGRLSEAELVLRKASAKGYLDARLNLAAVFERKRDWAEVLKIFESILAADEVVPSQAQIKERVRRLRSLSVSSLGKEKF